MDTGPRYISVQDAAAHLGVSRKRVERLIANGEVQTYRRRLEPRKTLLDRDELDQLLAIEPDRNEAA